MAITYHTYPALLYTGGRLAATEWFNASAEQSVAATLNYEQDAIILRVEGAVGYAPGGIAA